MPETSPLSIYHACCRKCSKIVLLGPDSVKCPNCGHENKTLEPDGTKVEYPPSNPPKK